MKRWVIAAALMGSVPVMAQGPAPAPANVDISGVLAAKGQDFLAKAKKAVGGSYSETLKDYGNHKTMLAARVSTGTPEYHAEWVDFFVVLEGEVTMVVGGKLKDEKPVEGKPGELTGSGIEGGTKVLLKKGDVFHLDAKTPHQAVLAPGKTLLYYVIKVKQ